MSDAADTGDWWRRRGRRHPPHLHAGGRGDRAAEAGPSAEQRRRANADAAPPEPPARVGPVESPRDSLP
jgi:hypothetical protein